MLRHVPVSLLAATALAMGATAQNLVPNPSFEQRSSCPTTSDQVFRCVSWSKPTNATTDYMNACHTTGIVGVPANVFGNQAARTGSAYMHMFTGILTSNYREYVQAQLTSPLVAGTTYDVSFWVSLSDGSREATAQIGAYLSTTPPSATTSSNLPFVPQIENPGTSILSNKNNWVEVRGSFVAAGGEQYITIGNFRDVANTNSISVSGLHQGASYYVDDVSVTAVASGGVVCTNHLIGWSDMPAPTTTGFLDIQDVDGGCKKAVTHCRTTIPVRAAVSYGGGTAYDARYQSVWVSDGVVLAEYDLTDRKVCRRRCPPVKATLANADARVSGLAM